MTIKAGDRLPDATFGTMTADGPSSVTTADVFAGKKVVVFAVPGAFTPTCHRNHMPGFVENAEAIKARGVDTIACLSVNDVFVMDAWAKASGADGKILMLADGSADFTRAIGLDLDMGARGFGTRSQRYSMLVEDGVVTTLNIETAAGEAKESGAAAMIEQLG